MSTSDTVQQSFRSTIPARLDRLRWSPFHTRMIIGLGVAWILDGLEITVASSIAGVLTQRNTLHLTTTQAAVVGSVYLIGEVVGALVFGRMADKLGRRSLFMVTLGVYLLGSGLTAFTFGTGTGWLIYMYATRFLAGVGIGGEYAAINSAIDEMMPSRYRGRVDIWINGTYWAGSILGSFVAFLLLNVLPVSVGWRMGFLVGPALAVVILLVRRNLPESPRWLITHGRVKEADETMRQIEEVATRHGQVLAPVDDSKAITLRPEKEYGYLTFLRLVFHQYPKRAILGASLMITQSFLYNAIFFTYALVLTNFYGVSANVVPAYGLAFAVGNLTGPLLLGHLFDTWGRKKMIAGTYILSGALLAASAWMFDAGLLNAAAQTFVWIVIFFFASAGASSAYLTVSEIFPVEIRAEAIAVFFAMAEAVGALGPVFYGALIGNGSNRAGLTIGYLIGGGIMILGGLIEVLYGINAERKALESVARPLTQVSS
jgi:MFS family permease